MGEAADEADARVEIARAQGRASVNFCERGGRYRWTVVLDGGKSSQAGPTRRRTRGGSSRRRRLRLSLRCKRAFEADRLTGLVRLHDTPWRSRGGEIEARHARKIGDERYARFRALLRDLVQPDLD